MRKRRMLAAFLSVSTDMIGRLGLAWTVVMLFGWVIDLFAFPHLTSRELIIRDWPLLAAILVGLAIFLCGFWLDQHKTWLEDALG